jgi:hypothetical protein
MILTEIHTAHIPDVYKRFADFVGDNHWKNRVVQLKQEAKGNRFLADYNRSENSITFQLEHLRELTNKFGYIPPWEITNHAIYPAASFATQILSIMDVSSKEFSERLKRRVHGAFKNPDDMRGLQLELSAATHFARRGLKISWPEMTGIGTFDLFVEELGPEGLEVECKSISENKGRKIHRREVLDFYCLLWPKLKETMKGLHSGLSAVVTIPERLPKQYSARIELAKQISKQVFLGQSATLSDGSTLKIIEFEADQLGFIPNTSNPKEIRDALDKVTQTRNREAMVIGTKAGGALALTMQSAQDDTLMKAIYDTLSDSAKKQLSGTRSGMFLAELHGIDGQQLISIASQDNDPSQSATLLRKVISKFFSAPTRDHVIGVGFLSKSNLLPLQDDLVDSGGTSYYFPKRESPFWSDDFSGLFS